jgi:hypothetical protein
LAAAEEIAATWAARHPRQQVGTVPFYWCRSCGLIISQAAAGSEVAPAACRACGDRERQH